MNKSELVYKMYIRSTPEKTWDAITKPEFTRQYWSGMANVSDWKKGSEWQHLTQENEAWITGEVVESVPPKRLVWVMTGRSTTNGQLPALAAVTRRL